MASWPLATDYSAAVQNPASCFTDAELASGQAATTMLGLPFTYAGNFANVTEYDRARAHDAALLPALLVVVDKLPSGAQ